ncbi:acyltransferase [Staphylococcus saprophyticus]|uniref:acyltransferase n=1 Tax=Staphylococcus saprophyticus TaxID=29385 RepID=UPI001012CA99|nr:acyltransferase [Staphylococcus saprophyticus]MDW4386061.1 acyltransferase [Staphylococcus saprophyticus]RXS20210.1 acyltransferase [Staphylococcus saprophyticus]
MNIYKILRSISLLLKLVPRKIREFFYEINTNTNLKIQIAIRYLILASLVNKIGDNVYIGKNVSLKNMMKVSIGHNVSIHDLCYIDGLGGIEIGDNVSIAHSSSIITTNHTWSDNGTPIKYNKVTKGKVVIKDDVWIGCGVRILSKVNISERSVIAAGAVVNSDLATGYLGAGVPMKVIKKLGE